MADSDKHRKRLRRYAGLFMALGTLQLLAGLILLTPSAEISGEEALGYCLSGAFLIAGALAAWNGSRIGAIGISAWILGNLILEVALGESGAVFYIRYAMFAILAVMMTVHAFRYWAAVRTSDEIGVRGWAALRWGGLVVMVPIFVLTVAGGAMLLAPMPVSDRILTSSTIPADQIDWMRENNLLMAAETPLLFYSEGLLSIAEGGNILTNQFLGAWSQTEEGELSDNWIRLGEICDVSLLLEEPEFGIARYNAHAVGGADPLEFWLPLGDPLHETFLERLDYLNAHHTNAELISACDEGRAADWLKVSKLNGLPGGMVEAADISQEALNWLRGQDYLFTGEEPRWLFSTARYDIAEGGVLMSNSHFGGWWEEGGIRSAVWFGHGEICSIEMLEGEGTEVFARYRASGADEGDYLDFSLPAKTDRTEEQLAELNWITEQRQTPEQAEACASGPGDIVEQASADESADMLPAPGDEEET